VNLKARFDEHMLGGANRTQTEFTGGAAQLYNNPVFNFFGSAVRNAASDAQRAQHLDAVKVLEDKNMHLKNEIIFLRM
jgi:hypothetical protein